MDTKAEKWIKGDQITSIHELAIMGNIHFSEGAARSKETAMQNRVLAAAMRLALRATEQRQATSFRQNVNIDSAIEIFFQELLPDQPFTLFLNRVAEKALQKIRISSSNQVWEEYVGMNEFEYMTIREHYVSKDPTNWMRGKKEGDEEYDGEEYDPDYEYNGIEVEMAGPGRGAGLPAIAAMQGRVKKMMKQGENISDPTDSKFLCFETEVSLPDVFFSLTLYLFI